MISRENKPKLIDIYPYIFNLTNLTLTFNTDCQHLNNNAKPDFSELELITIKLFAGYKKWHFQINEIRSFKKDYFLDWFLKLPTNQNSNY